MGVLGHLPGVGGNFYPHKISQSCRFNIDDDALMSLAMGAVTNRKLYTFSTWFKLTATPVGVNRYIMGVAVFSTDRDGIYINNNGWIEWFEFLSGAYVMQKRSANLFRDQSSWYHLVCSYDCTLADAASRARMYINGVEVVYSVNSPPTQNRVATYMNGGIGVTQTIGSNGFNLNETFGGYMAETQMIDGQQLTPNSFGKFKNGVWISKRYKGTYGNMGFYHNYSNSSNFGEDAGPNSRDFTDSGLATNDQVLDSPTNNYCTLNPLDNFSGPTMQEGNLEITSTQATVWLSAVGTFGVSSGKWYWEGIFESGANVFIAGIVEDSGRAAVAQYFAGGTAESHGYYVDGSYYNGGTYDAYGAGYSAGDICSVALDMDAGTMTCYKNNSSQGVMVTGLSGLYFPVISVYSNVIPDSCSINGGQLGFTYTPPTGFKALCSANLPEPEILEGNKGFDVRTYVANGTDPRAVIDDLEFSPDLVWIKDRDTVTHHGLVDSVRGAGAATVLHPNSADVEGGEGGTVDSFDSNGITVGDGSVDFSWFNYAVGTDDYVAWNWKKDPRFGFDIVGYTGTGVAKTEAHSLGVVPEMIIVKNRDAGDDTDKWFVYHKDNTAAPETDYLVLNANDATADDDTIWNDTAPTSSVFSVGTGHSNVDTEDYIAYLWASVEGFSKVFSYTGNGNADGPFIYCGFRPRFVIIKKSSGANNWMMQDTERETYNVDDSVLYANLTDTDSAHVEYHIDVLSNGFKLRTTGASHNGSASVYIGIAFAEHPFKYANAR